MIDEFNTPLTDNWTTEKYSDKNWGRGREYRHSTGWRVSAIFDGWISTKTSQNENDVGSVGWRRQEMITPNGHNYDSTNKETDLGKPYYFNTPEEAMTAVNNYLSNQTSS